jgi:hypothetical protein
VQETTYRKHNCQSSVPSVKYSVKHASTPYLDSTPV